MLEARRFTVYSRSKSAGCQWVPLPRKERRYKPRGSLSLSVRVSRQVGQHTHFMAVLSNLLRPLPAARRAYSVFSKPGGRYFNSAKPPKVGPVTNKGKVDASNTSNDAAPSKDQSTPLQPGATVTAEGALSSGLTILSSPVHPVINPQDLKLHQFFSLHRPLLLASQPASTIFQTSPLPLPFNIPSKSDAEATQLDGLEDPLEASAEDDADAARLLARAMVVNRIGPSMAWEQTLQRLGLDVTRGRAEEVRMAEAEFEVYLDSTKRKRRRKMKKHKWVQPDISMGLMLTFFRPG